MQCWGKLLLKVMHYNIALLHKKVTNCVTYCSYFLWKVMHYIAFVLLFDTWAGFVYLFLKTKLLFWQLERPFQTKSEINKSQAEGSASALGQERCQ